MMMMIIITTTIIIISSSFIVVGFKHFAELSLIELTRLSGPRSTPTTSQKIW
jgi:hypothetical protein